MLDDLIFIANRLDNAGLHKEASYLDQIIKEAGDLLEFPQEKTRPSDGSEMEDSQVLNMPPPEEPEMSEDDFDELVESYSLIALPTNPQALTAGYADPNDLILALATPEDIQKLDNGEDPRSILQAGGMLNLSDVSDAIKINLVQSLKFSDKFR